MCVCTPPSPQVEIDTTQFDDDIQRLVNKALGEENEEGTVLVYTVSESGRYGFSLNSV